MEMKPERCARHDLTSKEAEFWFDRAPNCLRIMERPLLARHAADSIVETMRTVLNERAWAVFVPSVGQTWRETYAVLRESHRAVLDWKRVVCVQMDEYVGLGCADPRSFAFQLQHELVNPLGIGQFLHLFDPAGKMALPLGEYENQVRRLGGIDCAVHGVGINGHIGFNEPMKKMGLETRCVRLSRTTRIANDIGFTSGVTLGLGILGEAKTSIVALLGPHKRKAAQNLLYGAASPRNPVASLRNCGMVSIYLDPEAGANLID